MNVIGKQGEEYSDIELEQIRDKGYARGYQEGWDPGSQEAVIWRGMTEHDYQNTKAHIITSLVCQRCLSSIYESLGGGFGNL
jgi:flagellar biosynthesis/type III secretory pathway protein FliH